MGVRLLIQKTHMAEWEKDENEIQEIWSFLLCSLKSLCFTNTLFKALMLFS